MTLLLDILNGSLTVSVFQRVLAKNKEVIESLTDDQIKLYAII